MKKESGTNNFDGGLVSDLSALTTPHNVLTDALNAAIITMNGNELSLQNDMGNISLVDPEGGTVQLTNGFIPIGIKENGGIIYVVSYNPTTLQTEIGSFPSPGFSPSSDASNTTDPSDIIVAGTDPLTTNKIGVTLPLSTKVMNVGDPFIVNLPGIDITNLTDWLGSQNLPGGNRKFYIPKLIDITSTGEIDITNKVTIQQRLDSSPNNFWFINDSTLIPTIPAANPTVFQQYINSIPQKVQRFPNIKTGVLGIKFDLETIDEFLVAPDSNGNNFPVLNYIHSLNSYTLSFNGFYIIEPSSIKCDTIVLNYTIYDNVLGTSITNTLVIQEAIPATTTPLTVGSVAPVLNIIDTDPSRVGIAGNYVLSAISLPNNNQTIVYTIIPSNTYYGIIFSNLIINDRLDLSRDPLTWGLHPYLDVISTITMLELIDTTLANSYIFTTIDAGTVVSNAVRTSNSQLNNWTNADLNINYTVQASSFDVNLTTGSYADFVNVTVTITAEVFEEGISIGSSVVAIQTPAGFKFSDSVTFASTIKSFVAQKNLHYQIIFTPTISGTDASHVTISSTTIPSTITWSHSNYTGYTIYPLVGRFGTVNGLPVPLDINDNTLNSTKQLIYEYAHPYGIDITTYDKEGTFTINTDNTAIFTSTQSPAIIELDKPVVRFVASGGGDE